MRHLILSLFIIIPGFASAQFGANFHQSNLPFIGLNYEINNRFRPELRIGIDNFIEETAIEAVVTYDLAEKDDYEIYAGIGARLNNFDGLVIPMGVNIFPLASKQFGFHIELAPLIAEATVLRGSWGIRYQFGRGNRR